MSEVDTDLVAPEDGLGLAGCWLVAALSLEVRPFLRLSRARRRRGSSWPASELAPPAGRARWPSGRWGPGRPAEAAVRLVAQFRPHFLVPSFWRGGEPGAAGPGLAGLISSISHPGSRLDPAPGNPEALAGTARSAIRRRAYRFFRELHHYPVHYSQGLQAGPLRSLTYPVLDLESAAVAGVARAEGLRCLGLRAITDTAAEEDPRFLAPTEGKPGVVGPLDALGLAGRCTRRLEDLVHLCTLQLPGAPPPGWPRA